MKAKFGLKGSYEVICRDKDGNLKWKEQQDNLIVNIWLNTLLDILYNGGSAPLNMYMGLVVGPAPIFAPADDLGGHVGWSEFINYDEVARPAWTPGAAVGQELENAAPVIFTINGGVQSVAGIFIIGDNPTKGDEGSGALISEVGFSSGSKNVDTADTLQVTYKQIAASA